jgi:predicted RNA-binding Zn-ribbon protein involved in translation (DUF1610 family)
METCRPFHDVRIGDEILHPVDDTWRAVESIAPPSGDGLVWLTFADGERTGFPSGMGVSIRAPAAALPPSSISPSQPLASGAPASKGEPEKRDPPVPLVDTDAVQASINAHFDASLRAAHAGIDAELRATTALNEAVLRLITARSSSQPQSAPPSPRRTPHPPVERWRAPYVCAACGEEGLGHTDGDLCPCGAISWIPNTAVARRERLERMRAPYICTACGEEGAGTSDKDLFYCANCGRRKPAQHASSACSCGAEEPWVYGIHPAPSAAQRASSGSPRQAPPAQAGAATLEQRILAAVRAGDLASANAVVKEIGGRRKDVYAAAKTMLADHRLQLVDGSLRAGK